MTRGIAAEPRTYALAIGVSGLFGAATVAVSQVLGVITDDVIVPALAGSAAARDRLPLAGLVLAAVAVTLGVSVALRRIFAGIGYADLQAGHRSRVTRQYLRLPMSWHRQHPTGQLLSNANSDVEAATGVFNPLPYALGVAVMIAVATVALLRADGWLAVAALAVLPVAVIANLVFQRAMSPAITRAQQLRAEVSDIAHESFEAALLVKSLGTAQREERRFAARAEELRHANVQVGRVRAVFDPAIDLLPGLGALLVLLVGTVRVQAGAIGTGDVVSAAYLLTLLAVPVRAFGWVLGELPRALVGYERIGRVIDARGELVPGTVPLAPVLVGGGLRVEMRGVGVDVPAGAGTSTLLSGIDLDLAPGRTVALVGPTGAGKTTLVGLLSRLSDPTTGTVTLDGVDVRDARPSDLTAQVALVAQSTFLFEDSVRANVTLADPDDPAAPDDDRVWVALRLARVDAVVAALPGGLDARLGERGANLSGGQRQRLAIARALVRNPRLLVLDDATSAVDPRVERQILTGLRERGADADRPTVLMVAYRMSSVLLADEVVHLEAGRIVDRGSHAELLVRDPGYAELATAYERETQRRADDRANGLLVDGDLTDLDDLETDDLVNDTDEPADDTAEDRR
ncbi:ABC transporter ATP-binding protein [Pengzhenrongella frigida]|uniref:ABC transporter ATP-binding protein n=1 Tax=Pengzhenrongella frigida TaxID=1259133 RepID=A0A4Q5N3N1_9MICO|nr:ABC transporter ATP-binding protein [Cellulomonas sp. HLT2-17]RYV52765.1 ABC transporter ATP-binding protein [Cellulomonas sp. HLT2-17]